MKTKKFITRYILLGFLSLLLLVGSCKKDSDSSNAVRLFRPTLISIAASNNTIYGSWQKMKGAVSYTVEISKDTFRTIDRSITIDSTSFVISDLKWLTWYDVRLRANASDSTLNSKVNVLGWYETEKFPTILATPNDSDIIDQAVIVRWTNSGETVTRIKVQLLDSTFVKEVTLSETDAAAQMKLIEGLTPGTTYTMYLYSGWTLRGWNNYTTRSTYSNVTIIDLRTVTYRSSILSDTLSVIPASSVVYLERGRTYSLTEAKNLSQTVTIMSGPGFGSTLATIALPYSFTLSSSSTIDSIAFKDVILTSSDYSSKYVFNLTSSTAISSTISRLSFENCKIEIFRGVIRLQGTSNSLAISTLSFNKCIIDSIGGYGMVQVDAVANLKIDNISITNSTIYKAQKAITCNSNSTSVLISNCTLNEVPQAAALLVDYTTTYNVSGGIKISNCIMGIGKLNATNLVKGVRAGSSTTVDGTGTYTTADYALATSSAYAVPNVIASTIKSYDLFTDPRIGNFTIKDLTFVGKSTSGDPRWRP
jgi:hypothetical protein